MDIDTLGEIELKITISHHFHEFSHLIFDHDFGKLILWRASGGPVALIRGARLDTGNIEKCPWGGHPVCLLF